jgi:poly-gamma-glutamate synthesis protein (capsule biosynthesis protein)
VAARNASEGDPDGYDFRSMFEPIRPWIADADWGVCHLEVNLAADNEGLSTFPVFRGPGAIADDLASVGFDSCSTASNHSLDWRTPATFETIEVLEDAGLRHTGTARSPEEMVSSTRYDVEGIQIAHLAYTYWFNGFLLPEDQPWAANQIDEQRILDDAARARADGAEFVVLSMHWGDQYLHEPNAQQAELGPTLLASPDIDLIVGHHAHVVQPIERIDGEWLVYGVGNLLSNQTQQRRRDELIVSATIAEQPDGSVIVDELQVIPVFLDIDTLTIWPSGATGRDPDTPPGLVPTLDASWARVIDVLERGSGWAELQLVGS